MRARLAHAPDRIGDLAAGSADIEPTLQEPWSDRTALVMCDFAELAYFAFEAAGGARELAMLLRPGGFDLVQTFSAGCTHAFLARAPGLAVLAFRGSASFEAWESNLDARLVPLHGGPPGLLVHEGFQADFEGVRAAAEAAVAGLPDDLPLYVTGHSMGGAVAQLAAAALEGRRVAAAYTFGSPRVATRAFDALVRVPHYRVVHDRDLVPGVPPAAAGFRHTGDPRLLLPGVDVALRRDRGLLDRVVVDAIATVAALTTGKLPQVEDHMIWEYRAALERVVAAAAPARTAA